MPNLTDACSGTPAANSTGFADFFKNGFHGNDPSKDLCSIAVFLEFIRDIALDLGGIVAVIMIMYAGYLYLNTNGDETKAETAKKTLLWSIGGMAIIVLAKVLIAFVGQTIKGKT